MSLDSRLSPLDRIIRFCLEKKLVVASISRWRAEGQFYRIEGSLANDSSRQVVYWQVDFEVLNEDGDVIDFGMKNSITPIAPGAEERWDVYLRGFDPAAARITQRVSEVRFAD